MLQRRRRLASVLAVVTSVLAVSGAVVAVARGRDRGAVAVPSPAAPLRPEASSSPPADQAPTAPPGSTALVDVAVATLWLEPGGTRPIDEPSLANPVDLHRWVTSLTVADKTWLVGRLATQALYGDRVTVLATSGDWSKVAVADQPSSLDPNGYPGWLPSAQLRPGPGADGDRWAVVTAPAARLGKSGLEVSFGTRLPLVADGDRQVTVAVPGPGQDVLDRSDVEVVDPAPPPPSVADIVDRARRFSGLGYLWAGTSALGYDCSGLTWALYRASGVVIPRDAQDQAGAGTAVEPDDLRAGDLLFYATGAGRDTVHHVALYAGDGTMIQSAATGRSVETVPVATSELSGEYWGARRFVP